MRLLSLALLLAFAAPQASAQIIPSLDIGVAGGLNFASLNDATGADLESSTGYHVGLYADVGVLFFSARTGLFYLHAGNIAGAGEDGEDGAVNFVTVPVDFQIQTPTPFAQAYALVGPEFRFPLEGLGTQFDKKSVNTAINVGAGLKGGVPLVGPSGFIELRYALDVTGFADEVGLGEEAEDYKVNLFMVRAGIGI